MAAAVSDRAVRIKAQSSVIRRLLSLETTSGGAVVSPQYVQRLQTDAAELDARARALMALTELMLGGAVDTPEGI
jgi:hypothetical protein